MSKKNIIINIKDSKVNNKKQQHFYLQHIIDDEIFSDDSDKKNPNEKDFKKDSWV